MQLQSDLMRINRCQARPVAESTCASISHPFRDAECQAKNSFLVLSLKGSAYRCCCVPVHACRSEAGYIMMLWRFTAVRVMQLWPLQLHKTFLAYPCTLLHHSVWAFAVTAGLHAVVAGTGSIPCAFPLGTYKTQSSGIWRSR